MKTWDSITIEMKQRALAIKEIMGDLLWWAKHPNCSAATDKVVEAITRIAIKFDFADLLKRELESNGVQTLQERLAPYSKIGG